MIQSIKVTLKMSLIYPVLSNGIMHMMSQITIELRKGNLREGIPVNPVRGATGHNNHQFTENEDANAMIAVAKGKAVPVITVKDKISRDTVACIPWMVFISDKALQNAV